MQAIQNCEISITKHFFKDILLLGESISLGLLRSIAVLRQSCGWDAKCYSFSCMSGCEAAEKTNEA